MKTTSKTVLKGALVALALSLASTGAAWAAPIHVTWTGSGWDTHVDNLEDGWPVNLISAMATGSFGAKRAEIATEFYVADPEDFDITCKPGYDMFFGIVLSTSVVTFEAHDQLFAFSNSGWMCLSTAMELNGHFYGEAYGVYGGGTGRFNGATGEWMTTFEGNNLEMPEAVSGLIPVGFRAISGEIKGHVTKAGFAD
jgi:hypothetical protein